MTKDQRISALEHQLRGASGKFSWLAMHHLHPVKDKVAREVALAMADECWRAAAGEAP